MRTDRPAGSGTPARPKPFTFYPPKNNRLVTAIVKKLLRRDIRRKLKVHDIRVSDDTLVRLRRLKGQRCLVTPSHSGGFEPHIVMYVSKLLDEDFNYVAAMELFARSRVHRWILQRLGVYSIIRGAVDRPSFTTTREILAAGKHWLVIFPEGESVGQNSIVIPFQSGVFQLAFKALEDAAKTENSPSLYCIPLAIRYVYLQDMHGEIDASLDRLESKLAIPSIKRSSCRYDRLRRVAEAVLIANERVHQFQPDVHNSMNDRIQRLMDHVLSGLEARLGISPTAKQPLIDRIRAAFIAVDRVVEQESAASEYEQRLTLEQQHAARELYHDLWRALRFVAIYDGYVAESLNVERFLDVLGLLELEVFKRLRIWGPRRACVEVAEPVDLQDHLSSYLLDKRETAKRVAAMLETTVRQLLNGMEAECQPLRLES